MSKSTGIVMELNKKNAIIMTNCGEFLKVSSGKSAPKVGEIYTGEAVKSTPIYKYALTAASLVFILFFGSSAYAYYTPAASLKVDINPSLSLDINKWNRIIKYHALNSDGEKVLSGINLKYKPLNEGLDLIVDEAKKDNFINDNYIKSEKVINVSIENKKADTNIDLSEFKEYIAKNNLKVNITAAKKSNNGNLPEKKDNIKKDNAKDNTTPSNSKDNPNKDTKSNEEKANTPSVDKNKNKDNDNDNGATKNSNSKSNNSSNSNSQNILAPKDNSNKSKGSDKNNNGEKVQNNTNSNSDNKQDNYMEKSLIKKILNKAFKHSK